MTARGIMKRLRSAAGSALVWGAGWGAGSFIVFQALLALGVLPGNLFWADGLLVAARLGLVGGLAGAAFSLFIGIWYRGHRLAEISWWRFAAAGGLLAGAGVPAFLLTMSWLSGDGVAVRYVADDALLAALFGAAVAGGSMKLAQRADAEPGGTAGRETGRPAEAAMLRPEEIRNPGRQRSRDAQRAR